MDALFEEQKDMRLLDDVYPVDDVSRMFDEVRALVRSQLNEELERFSQQNALYLRQLFLQAEGNGVSLSVDLSNLDDAVLLAGMEKLDVKSSTARLPSDLPPTTLRATTLKPVEGANVDARLVMQIKELQEANRSLLAKFDKLQSQCQSAEKEASALREKQAETQSALDAARKDLTNLQSSNHSAQQLEIERLRSELESLRAESSSRVDGLKSELKELNETLTSKVNNAPQYQQLKKLMNTKNEQLKEARARIKQLEEHLGKNGN